MSVGCGWLRLFDYYCQDYIVKINNCIFPKTGGLCGHKPAVCERWLRKSEQPG